MLTYRRCSAMVSTMALGLLGMVYKVRHPKPNLVCCRRNNSSFLGPIPNSHLYIRSYSPNRTSRPLLPIPPNHSPRPPLNLDLDSSPASVLMTRLILDLRRALDRSDYGGQGVEDSTNTYNLGSSLNSITFASNRDTNLGSGSTDE